MAAATEAATARPRAMQAPPPRLHETLMGSMMARSTPRVLFQSALVKHTVTALEIAAALQAIAMLALLFSLHVRFVRRDGCATLLIPDCAVPDYLRRAAVIEISVNSLQPHVAHARYRFANERGFLLLSDKSLRSLNVSVAAVPLRADDPCIGGPLARHAVRNLVGYDTIAVNAFARLRRRLGQAGYVLALDSRRVVNLGHADPALAADAPRTVSRVSLRILWKCGAVMTAVFITCTTGALVAFTLKEVQLRMIKLTMELQYIMRSQQGYGRVVFRYALDALVFVPIVAGMLFFLFEFFDDQALAFAVLCIAWLCEFAASGSTRHWVSRLYLPRLFLCYFGGFHLYFFSFPLGFTWLALATSIAFMLHAALTIWNHCELPLLRRRDRSARERWG